MNYRHQMILMMIIASALLRFVPFIIFNKTSKLPKQLVNLSKNLPLTAMGMLVIYCLKDINISNEKNIKKYFKKRIRLFFVSENDN